jgi:hypothetical protein
MPKAEPGEERRPMLSVIVVLAVLVVRVAVVFLVREARDAN